MSVSSDEGDTLHHHVSHDFTNKRAFYVQCDCSSSQAGRHFTGIKSRRLISKKYDPQPSSSSLETSLNPPSLTHVIAPVTCGQSREVGHVSKGIRRELLSRLRAFIQPLRLLLHRHHQEPRATLKNTHHQRFAMANFWDLPKVARQKIYRLHLIHGSEFTGITYSEYVAFCGDPQPPPAKKQQNSNNRIMPSLLMVDRKIEREASQI